MVLVFVEVILLSKKFFVLFSAFLLPFFINMCPFFEHGFLDTSNKFN